MTPSKQQSLSLCDKIKSPITPNHMFVSTGCDFQDVNLHNNDQENWKPHKYHTFRAFAGQCWEGTATLRKSPACKLAVTLIALIVGICLIVVPKAKSNHNDIQNTKISQYAMNANGIYDPTCLAKITTQNVPVQAFPALLVELIATVTDLEILQHPCSVQYQALLWLFFEQQQIDTMKDEHEESLHVDLTQPIAGLEATLILQRYTILVLTFAVGAPEEYPQLGRNTCVWPGIQCVTAGPSAIRSIAWPDLELKGRLPQELSALAGHLTYFDLADNQITGELPEGLLDCNRLEYLYLHNNSLTGPLPHKLQDLKHLSRLYLGSNQFTGPITSGLGSESGSARSLRYLSLYNNRLTGKIPTDMNWRFMFWLDLSHNQLTGELPLDWAEGSKTMINLRHLFVNDNKLTGEIPPTYPTMGNQRLEMFHAGNNQFRGMVPGNYSHTKFIKSIEMQGNDFKALDPAVCGLIVFEPQSPTDQTELVNLKLDCDICSCTQFCEPGYCYGNK